MRIIKVIIGLTLSILLGSGVVVAADFDKGLEAYKSGDFKTALAEWTPLAEQGVANAQSNIGQMYKSGLGVLASGTKAVKWLTLAAEQGNIKAQSVLGDVYREGNSDVVKNYTASKNWYEKAAQRGDMTAQSNLGVMYELGMGVEKNTKTAVNWYTNAAKQGYALAQFNLGTMYDFGRGVLTDTKRAYMWYNLASYNGSVRGGKNKDLITKIMTPADISKAQDMSSQCLESNYTDC